MPDSTCRAHVDARRMAARYDRRDACRRLSSMAEGGGGPMAGVIQRFEQRLEGAVTGAFARAFRSAVQPVEIAAALQREVDNSAHILSRERMLVPNDFTVELSPSDHERLSQFSDTLVQRALPARRGARQGAAVHPRRPAQHRLRRERRARHRPVPGAQPHQRLGHAGVGSADDRDRDPLVRGRHRGQRHAAPAHAARARHRPRQRSRAAHRRPRHLPPARADLAQGVRGRHDRHRRPTSGPPTA